MRMTDVTRISFRQIFRMRRRYAGPLIGGILGTAMLIVVISVGDLVYKSIGTNLAVLGGVTLIRVNLPLHDDDFPEDSRRFTDQDLNDIRRVPGTKVVAPSVFSWWPAAIEFTATYQGEEYRLLRVAGVDSHFFTLLTYLPIREGRGINDLDVETLRGVCVIGDGIREILFGDKTSPLGKTLYISGLGFQVVGVLGEPEDTFFDGVVFVPISVARKKMHGLSDIRRVTVLPTGLDTVDIVHRTISTLLKSNRPLYRYHVWYEAERVALLKNILKLFNLFVNIAILATLFLSAIGIANIMSALVKERTAEIGLRKAVGATEWDVTLQFLCESVSISTVSTVSGIMLGSVIVLTTAALVWQSQVEYSKYAVAVLVALITGGISGIASGVIPAKMASQLNPVEAMRFE